MNKNGDNGIRILCLDVGATKIRMALVYHHYGESLGQSILADTTFPAADLPEQLEQDIKNHWKKMYCSDFDVVAISAAGGLDRDRGRLMYLSNKPLWKNIDFVNIFKEQTSEIFIENDANSAVLAHYYLNNNFEQNKNISFLTCSSELGQGRISDGKLALGANGAAGEIGHTIVHSGSGARACGCGQKGCLETYVGLNNLAKFWHKKLLRRYNRNPYANEDWWNNAYQEKGTIDSKDIFTACFEGNYKTAKKIVREFQEYTAVAIGNDIANNNPDIIYLGGVASYWGEKLVQPIREIVSKRFVGFPESVKNCQIKISPFEPKDLQILSPLSLYFWKIGEKMVTLRLHKAH